MRKEALDNLTKGRSPSLHPADPNWDTLKGLVERARESLEDARKKDNTCSRQPVFEITFAGTSYLPGPAF
jgi:hypothetical protein